MTDLASYFGGGGAIIAILWFVFNSYMAKRKQESEDLKAVTLKGEVKDAIHETRLDEQEKRIDHLENKVYER